MTPDPAPHRVRIVLCRPSHAGNIGAASRAMKTMGLADLRLVAPEKFPAPEARWMATNAIDVLDTAQVHATLAEALGDCVAAYALSARPREWSTRVTINKLSPAAIRFLGSFLGGNAGPDTFRQGQDSA